MTVGVRTPVSWWGDFKFDKEQGRQWRIGPLMLVVRCLGDEWQIAHQNVKNIDDDDPGWEISDTDLLPESLEDNSRYIFHDPKKLLNIAPMLADRPVISRPSIPFNLTAGEEVTLYVSSPLWVELAAGSPPGKTLGTVAIQRPSDTWFGPSTLEGELCYASTTHCWLNLDEMPQRPHRAITPVLIRNQADTTLSLERLNIPAPLLSLYASTTGQLWTSRVTLIREKDGDMAKLSIDNKAPKEANKVVLVNKPRDPADSSMLIRAFNAVFS